MEEFKETVIFCQSDLPQTSFSVFEDMQKKGELCDLEIKVQNHTITAHRLIVAAGIPYFRSLFRNDEGKNEKADDISISDLDPGVLESIIDFAYSSKINISSENVHSILKAANFFQLQQVTDACLQFLSQRLRWIRDNFETYVKYEDFLSLSESCVKVIIMDDNLGVSSESVVFEAIVKWVKISPTERHALLPELLAEVRMIDLPVEYLITRVDSEELIRNSDQCKELINEVKNYHLSKNKSLFTNLKKQPRNFKTEKFHTYAISVYEKRKECSLYSCDFRNKVWNTLSTNEIDDYDYALYPAVVKDKMYLFLKSTIQTFHFKTLEWEELKMRHTGLELSCILSHGSIIYCFGSSNTNFSHKVRYFDTETNKWLTPGVMSKQRWACAGALLGESIYISGGYCVGTLLKRVDKFDPVTFDWSEASPMLTARSSHGCISVGTMIYVFGGWTESWDRICTAEVYDPVTNQWNYISPMSIKRSLLSVISRNGTIYAHGGTSDSRLDTQEVEIYDPESDQWSAGGFCVPRGFRCAVSVPISGN